MINWTTACTKCLWMMCWLWNAVQLWVSLSWKALNCSDKLLLKRINIFTLLSGVWNTPGVLRVWALPALLVQGSGREQFQEHELRYGKYTSPKQKKRAGETFPGGMNTQCRNSSLLEALGACREYKSVLCLSSCVIAPSTAGNEKYNSGKAVASLKVWNFFPVSLFSGNYKEAEFHDYRTWLMFLPSGIYQLCLLCTFTLGFKILVKFRHSLTHCIKVTVENLQFFLNANGAFDYRSTWAWDFLQ